MRNKTVYNKEFYLLRDEETKYSAIKIVDEILQFIVPKSVVDLGCGVGTFLNTFKEKIPDIQIFGCDGDYVPNEFKVIKEKEFYNVDLSKKDFSKTIFENTKMKNKFDLAITLEVAEHINKECADDFVKNLCTLSDTIVFSAAIPGQGGIDHVNEQWVSWWKEKFEKNSYKMYDIIRPSIWEDSMIKVWYRQNVVVFSKYEIPQLKEKKLSEIKVCDMVHPELFLPCIKEKKYRSKFMTRVLFKLYSLFDKSDL